MRSGIGNSASDPIFVSPVGGSAGTDAQQVQGNAAHDAVDSGNPVKVGGVADTTRTAVAAGDRTDLKTDLNSNLFARLVLGAGAGSDGDSNSALGFGTQTSGTTSVKVAVAQWEFNGTSWDRQRKPNATSRIVSAAASTNGTSAKASAGDVFRVSGYNANAAARYLKIYNKASAPTVGTDTPVWTEYLAPQSKFELSFPKGLYLGTGIAYALTTGSADADTGALTAGDILGLNLAYA